MGRSGILSAGSNANLRREAGDKSFYYCVHRARVTDVHIDKGTVDVDFEKYSYRREVTFPLLGLSSPPKPDPDVDPSRNSSWGRYIPQVGDMILVGFSPSGEIFALGYHAIYYGVFDSKDEARQEKGGIGWGKASDRRMKPGDWDFRSSRGGMLYIGDRSRIGSGSATIELSKSDSSVTTTTNLNRSRYGQASETRNGDVKRLLLPTDTQESYVASGMNPLLNAQESLDVVRVGSSNPAYLLTGQELARHSIGEVIDDDAAAPILMQSSMGSYVRQYIGIKDALGATRVYESKIDMLGNYEVSALTATQFQWSMPLAAWDVTNLSTSFLSTNEFEVTAGQSISMTAGTTFDITAGTNFKVTATQAALEAATVNLGVGASDFLIKGTTFMSYFQALLIALAADMTAISGIIGVGAGTSAAANTMNGASASYLSTVSKTI